MKEKFKMSNPVDTKVVSKLAEILEKSGLAELEIETEDCRISLVKSRPQNMVEHAPVYAAPAPVVSAPVAIDTPVVESVVDLSKLAGCVKSPMVGVVYLSNDPNTANYVKIGDSVNQGDTVCLIEAMKTFNPVKAHVGGKVTKILVQSGDPVEYGEPLIVIE